MENSTYYERFRISSQNYPRSLTQATLDISIVLKINQHQYLFQNHHSILQQSISTSNIYSLNISTSKYTIYNYIKVQPHPQLRHIPNVAIFVDTELPPPLTYPERALLLFSLFQINNILNSIEPEVYCMTS